MLAVQVTFNTSPDKTERDAVKLPAENKVPVVLSFVALPPMLIKQPATVPVDVIENDTAEDVVLVLVDDAKYVLNYYPDTVLSNTSNDFTIKRTVILDNIKRKI